MVWTTLLIGYSVLIGNPANKLFNIYRPKEILLSSQSDFNKDGTLDILLTTNSGEKIPLYGIRDGDKITAYVCAEQMKQLYPESIIDYDTIEARLNEKK